MKQLRIQFSLILCLLALSTASFAKPGFYLGGNFGYGQYDTTDVPGNVTVNKNWPAGGLFGGYLWNYKQLDYGIEVSGNYYSKKKWAVTDYQYSLQSYTVGLASVLRYHFNTIADHDLYLQAKAGAEEIFQKTTASSTVAKPALPWIGIPDSTHDLVAVLGVGAGYAFNAHWSTDVLYTHAFGHKTQSPVLNDGTGEPATKDQFNTTASIDSVFLRLVYTL